jgi:hypothetical protein
MVNHPAGSCDHDMRASFQFDRLCHHVHPSNDYCCSNVQGSPQYHKLVGDLECKFPAHHYVNETQTGPTALLVLTVLELRSKQRFHTDLERVFVGSERQRPPFSPIRSSHCLCSLCLGRVRWHIVEKKKVVLPAIRGGMHAACTSVGVRMDIAAKAETICFETPRLVKDRIWLLKEAWSSFSARGFGSFLCESAGSRAFIEGKRLIGSMGGLESRCKVVEENTEVGGTCEDEVFDRCALSTESASLSDPMSLSHSSNRTRLVGLGDCVSFFNRLLSPIIRIRALGRGWKGQRWVKRSNAPLYVNLIRQIHSSGDRHSDGFWVPTSASLEHKSLGGALLISVVPTLAQRQVQATVGSNRQVSLRRSNQLKNQGGSKEALLTHDACYK